MVIGNQIAVLRHDDARAGGSASCSQRGDGHHTGNDLFIDLRQRQLAFFPIGNGHPESVRMQHGCGRGGCGLRRRSKRRLRLSRSRHRRQISRGCSGGIVPPVQGHESRCAEQKQTNHGRQPTVTPPFFRRTVSAARAVVVPIWIFALLFFARIQIHETSLRCPAPSSTQLLTV